MASTTSEHAHVPDAVRALARLGWVEGVQPAGDAVVLAYNEPDSGLGLWVQEPQVGGALRSLAPGHRPDAGTVAVRGDRMVCSLRARDGRCRPAVVGLDGEVRLLAARAAVRHRAVAWFGDDEIITTDDPDTARPALVAMSARGDGDPRRLVELGDAPRWTDPRPSVSADGRVLHTVADDGNMRIDVWDPTTGQSQVVLRGNPSAAPVAASWSPDGQRAVCLVRRNSGPQLLLLDLTAESMAPLPVPRPTGLPAWRPDGQALALQLEDWPATRVAVFELETGALAPAPLPEVHSAHAPAWQGEEVLFVVTAAALAPRAWRWHPATGAMAQVSPAFELPDHPDPRPVRVPGGQGFDLPGLLHEPERPRADGAAVLFLHGGPATCWHAGWDPVATTFVRAGFRVLQGDTRGSRFSAWDLPCLGPGAFGREDVADALALVEFLAAGGAPVAIYAHSYGTFVAHRTSLRDERVRGLVLTSGFLDPADLDASEDVEVRRFRRFAFGEAGRAPRPELPASCPVLLVHGDQDTQVPLTRAQSTLARLQGAGHELMVLEGEGHAFTGREPIARWIPEALAFVERALDGTGDRRSHG